MKLFFFLLALVGCAAIVAWRRARRIEIFSLANIAEGYREDGRVSRFPEVEIPTGSNGLRNYLFAANTETPGVATIAGVDDIPLGVWGDSSDIGSAGGAEWSDLTTPLLVSLLGSSKRELLISINSSVSNGDWLVPDANGYARTLPTAPGTYWVCGRATEAGIAGDIISFDPCLPYPVTVAA